MFLQAKRTADFSVAHFIIYSVFQSLSGKLFFLFRFAYLHTQNGKIPIFPPSIFVGLRCCVRLCTFVKQGRCQTRYCYWFVFRVVYLQFLLTSHRHLFGLVPFQLSHTLFESLPLFWGVGLRHHFSESCHHPISRFIS